MVRNRRWRAVLVCSTALVSASMLAIPALVPVMTPAQAQTQTQHNWTGAASIDWFTRGNWQEGTVPGGAGDRVEIDTATPNETVLDGTAPSGSPPRKATVGPVVVGRTGTGVLTIQNGGILESDIGPTGENGIGVNPGSQGTVTVTGPGSLWGMNGALAVRHGTLAIEDGGRVRAIGTTTALVTIDSGGIVTVTGRGSSLETNDLLEVGVQGAGTLTIAAGVATSARGVVGDEPNSTGTVTVTGTGSRWNITDGLAGEDPPPGALIIGAEGIGTVTVADGGVVSTSGPINVGQMAGSTGTLNIGAAPGQSAAAPGDVQAPSIAFGAGTGTINFNHTSPNYTFAPAISGPGSVNQLAGTTILPATNTYTGPTTINGGTLRVNGSIASPTTVNAGGTLGGTGTIFNAVTNAGTVMPGPGPGQIGALTIAGNYVGNGGTLAINTALGGDSSPTSQLILNGGNASGSTGIRVTNLGGAGAQTTNGIPIVVAQNGATTAGAFSLAAPVAAGLYQYQLFQGLPSGGNADQQNSWYLRSSLINPNPGPNVNPVIPLFRPEGAIYATMASTTRSLNMATIGSFHDRNGDQGLVRGNGTSDRVWARLFGQNAELASAGTLDGRFKGNMAGVQSGIDLYRSASPSGYESRVGFFGSYSMARGDVSGFALGQRDAFAGNSQVEAFSVGGYWTQTGVPGWYIDTVLLGSRFDGNGKSINQVGVHNDGFGVAASVEAGYPIPLGGGVRLEPQAQLVYQHLDFSDTADALSSVAHDTSDGLAGRLGLRLAADTVYRGTRLSPYLKASVWQDWTGTDRVIFAATDVVEARQRGTSVELGGGIAAQFADNFGLWASADYTTDVAGAGERKIVRGNVGMRWQW